MLVPNLECSRCLINDTRTASFIGNYGSSFKMTSSIS